MSRCAIVALLIGLLFIAVEPQYRDSLRRAAEVHAPKGRFLVCEDDRWSVYLFILQVHMLHSAYFFQNRVNVKWTATTKGKPSLPLWLHLFASKHRGIAYLIGTPVTPLQQVTIHVIARDMDSFDKAEQFLTIFHTDDPRYNATTSEIVELKVSNVEAEEFLNSRGDQLKRLERSIQETFRGKMVNPYLFNVQPEYSPPESSFGNYASPPLNIKPGSIIQIGTQASFHPNVLSFVNALRSNREYCESGNVALDRHWSPALSVNWCAIAFRNITPTRGFTTPQPTLSISNTTLRRGNSKFNKSDDHHATIAERQTKAKLEQRRREMVSFDFTHPYYFFESVVIFPLLAVVCLGLLVCLTIVFFGRREGQRWRDFRTPKEQLHQYLTVRQGQRNLRELSVQRQVLIVPSASVERSKSTTPLGIGAYLQPRQSVGGVGTPKTARHDRQIEQLPSPTPRTSVGRQTVGEAARAVGSSLNLYRNPLDVDDDE